MLHGLTDRYKLIANSLLFTYGALVLVVDKVHNIIPIILFLVSLSFLFNRKYEIPHELKLLYLAFFLYVSPILLSISLGDSSWSYFDDPVRFLLFIPTSIFLSHLKLETKGLSVGLFIGGLIAICFMLPDFLSGIMRDTRWENPNVYSVVIVGVFTFYFSSFGLKNSLYEKGIALVGQLTCFLLVIISGSRGALLGLVSVTLLYVVYRIAIGRFKFISVLIIVVFTIIALTYGGRYIEERFKDGLLDYEHYLAGNISEVNSIGVRLELWKESLLLFELSPIIGHGNRGFIEQRELLINDGSVNEVTRGWIHYHSDYFESLVTRGILGFISVFILYLTIIYAFMRRYRENEELSVAGILFVVSYMINSLAEVPLRNSYSLMFFYMMVTLMLSLSYSTAADDAVDNCCAEQ